MGIPLCIWLPEDVILIWYAFWLITVQMLMFKMVTVKLLYTFCAAEGDEALLKYFYGVRASAAITDNLDRTPMHVAAGLCHLFFNFFFCLF